MAPFEHRHATLNTTILYTNVSLLVMFKRTSTVRYTPSKSYFTCAPTPHPPPILPTRLAYSPLPPPHSLPSLPTPSSLPLSPMQVVALEVVHHSIKPVNGYEVQPMPAWMHELSAEQQALIGGREHGRIGPTIAAALHPAPTVPKPDSCRSVTPLC